jgi:hypothetical protein
MNSSSLSISQSSQDFSQHNMWPQSSLCPIIGCLHTWIKNEREPVVKAIADFSNEFPDLNFQVLSVDPML